MGLFIAAFIATLITAAIFLIFCIHLMNGKKSFYVFLVIGLPLSPLVNLCIKKPVFGYLLATFNLQESPKKWPLWFGLIVLIIVGVTEELIKVLPLVFKRFNALVTDKKNAFSIASFLGLGFGIGEIWYLAWSIHIKDPKIAALPFYMLSGFTSERALAVLSHIVFLMFPLFGLLEGTRGFTLGLSIGILLHSVFDTIAMLYQMDIISVGIASILLIAESIIVGSLFIRFFDKANIEMVGTPGISKNARTLYEKKQDR